MPFEKGTPPHYPLYKVRLSEHQIKYLVAQVFPGAVLMNVSQVPSDDSFNNRIYFLTIKRGQTDSISKDSHDEETSAVTEELQAVTKDVVLKVCGVNFGAEKIQNEVSVTLLLEKYCPSIPTPRIIAWSEHGTKFQHSVDEASKDLQMPEEPETRCRGWIMMTKLPGRILTEADVEGPHGENIMLEIARYTAQWRQTLISPNVIGNLRLRDTGTNMPQSATPFFALSPTYFSQIDGILMTDSMQPTLPVSTATSYYKHTIQDALTKLETNEVHNRIRSAVFDLLQEFAHNDLKHLPFLLRKTKQPLAFTHYDLSPRNFLISEPSDSSLSTVTGVLDFEFAGFFPEEEEFTKTLVDFEGDWPAPAYQIFMEELERLGIQTPARGIRKDHFEQACTLVQVIRHIAPWWLPGSLTGPEIDKESDKSIDVIEKGIGQLRQAYEASKEAA